MARQSRPWPVALALFAWMLAVPVRAAPADFVVRDALVVDGTGARRFLGSVRVQAGRIVKLGRFEPRRGETVIEGRGLALAPGFIDPHNHSDRGLESEPLAESQISQGITTVLLGQDGGSPWPIAEYLAARRKEPAALNLALCVGHATVRRQVMGEDYKRPALPDEVVRMQGLVEQGFREGAICLSSGLEYEVGGYAATDEVVALARVAARHGGFYISHIRDEADRAFEAMRELLEIGARGRLPVQNTHVKVGTVAVWGRAGEAVGLFADARGRGQDVSADCYPWDAWSSTILVLVPNKQYGDHESVAKGLADVGGAQNVRIVRYEKDASYEFRTLDEIARSRGVTPVELFIEIAKSGGASVVCRSMTEEDIRTFYAWPFTMVSSDGGIGLRHPRSAGSYPRVLGRLVREKHWLTLEEAVRRMTSLPAWRLTLRDRGRIAKGLVADLLLFDAERVIDNSTFEEPFKLATGIEKVWVGGRLVWNEGKATGERPGRILTR